MDDKNEIDGGFSLTPSSLSCLPCRCRKHLYHKETTHTKDENKQVITIVEDRSSFSMGKRRGITPSDEIFKNTNDNLQLGDISIYAIQVLDEQENKLHQKRQKSN